MEMQKNAAFKQLAVGITLCSTFLLGGCQNSDTDLKADVTTKAEQNKDFAGVRFTVQNGIVTLNGQCATPKSKSSVESTVKGIYGVKNVRNNIIVAPVTIGTDQDLKKSVDSVLKKYAGVQALVQDSVVTLEGTAKGEEVSELSTAISRLQPKKVQNNLSVKENG